MAIMGFGGGAILGAPLATVLMKAFADAPVSGIPHTLFVMAAMYFCLMMTGSLAYRVPPPGWQPASMGLPQAAPAADPKYSFKNTLAKGHVHVDRGKIYRVNVIAIYLYLLNGLKRPEMTH